MRLEGADLQKFRLGQISDPGIIEQDLPSQTWWACRCIRREMLQGLQCFACHSLNESLLMIEGSRMDSV